MQMNEKLNQVWETLIKKIEDNPGIWQKPWFNVKGSDNPVNQLTGKPYQGFNIFSLNLTRMIKGYGSNRWITFNQCKSLNGYVRSGEKGTQIIIYNPPKYKEEIDQTTGEKITVFIRGAYFGVGYVFNVEQTTLKPEDVKPVPIESTFKTIPEIEEIIKKTGAIIQHSPQNKAFYSPVNDVIVLPEQSQFKTIEGYYSTKFHELIHWSGHEKRLNRLDKNAYFGSEKYSREELTAEIGSVFLKASTGINDNVDDASKYIKNWWNVIKEDKGSLIEAAGRAHKAKDFILNS